MMDSNLVSMSDMLKLVVRIGNSQYATLQAYHCLSVVNLHDKLKHVGHRYNNHRKPSERIRGIYKTLHGGKTYEMKNECTLVHAKN
jgi:hypothetical protein